MRNIMTECTHFKSNKNEKLSTIVIKNTVMFCLFFTLSACSLTSGIDIPEELAHDVEDVRILPQSTTYFSKNNQIKNPDALLISAKKSAEETIIFRDNFFRAWVHEKPTKGNIAYFKSVLDVSYGRRGYAENLQKWTKKHFMSLADNANYKNAPSMSINAIITTNTALRTAPTKRPYFYQPKNAGDAYPFDMFQNSSLSLGVPVKVFHVSKDGHWYYVESASAGGWVFGKDLAFVDKAFIDTWKNNTNFAAIIQDEVELITSDLTALVSMGTILPIVEDRGSNFLISVPNRDARGNVIISNITISKNKVAQQPLPFTATNVAKIASPLMGNLYGWGGLYNNRDCSSTLQDLYTAFGIWLPRNSKAQAQQGEVISLAGMTNKEKEKEILAKAIPFQTFIFLPGHIGLYVGQYNKQAAIFHNVWGIRLKNDGRFVIGKTVITSLYPGMENPDATKSLMTRVQSFNIIAR